MAYALAMSEEIHDWLIGLQASDPQAAVVVGTALVALLGEGAGLGPPVVVAVAGPSPQWLAELIEGLDWSYQDRLERVQGVRRWVSEAAGLANEIRAQITTLESDRAVDAPAADQAAAAARLAELRQLLTGVSTASSQLTEASQRIQAENDAFRVRKETLKARYIAAQAERSVATAMALATTAEDGPDDGRSGEHPDRPAADTAGQLSGITAELERELGLDVAPDGLMELRAGAPCGSEIVIFFAVEPPGTALLISVLEGPHDMRSRHEAVALSADVLHRVRAGDDPEASARAFDDEQSFLDEFFPCGADQVAAGAAALRAGRRTSTLADQRARLGLTQAQVAERMGVAQDRVVAIERDEPSATEVGTLASYVEALGGRLDLIADFGADRVVLRLSEAGLGAGPAG